MAESLTYSFKGNDGQRIRVTVDPSRAQANVCRFVVEPAVYPEGGVRFAVRAEPGVSPLADKLFLLGDVTEVLIAGNSVTLTSDTSLDWESLSSRVAAVIRDQLQSGVPAVSPSYTEKLPAPEDVRRRVQEIIDTAINPAVAMHGGVVRLLDVKGNNVYLEFGGGCQGCGMVSVTLKYGVERLLRDRIPEIGEILDTTDHAAGTNPYYAPAAK